MRIAATAALLLTLSTLHAAAACPRPSFAAAEVVESQRVRVHYTLSGADATGTATANVVRDVAEEALAAYQSWGYPLPPSDCDGDPRYDVYLVDFRAGDGQTVVEACAGAPCPSYARVARDLGSRYPSVSIGAQTVVAHELFHAVQYALTTNLPPFWSEGTAQYAAKRLHPHLHDLESFLPTFFAEPERPLDSQGAAAVGSWQYSTAIWPTFLAARFEPAIVRDILVSGRDLDAFEAMDAVLNERGSSLGAAFAEFAGWNAATGSRWSPAGYPDGAVYPELALVPLEDTADEILTSLGARYYSLDATGPVHLALAVGDLTQLTVSVIPATASLALNARVTLTATGLDLDTGSYVIVVASTTTSKRDNPFALHVTSRDVSRSPITPSPASSTTDQEPLGGCSMQGTPMSRTSLLPFAALLLALVACKRAPKLDEPQELRIVSVGSANTETVFALGKGANVVAVDTSSLFPESATRLPQIGYQRALSAEGVLSVRPTLVLLPIEGGPPDVVAQLRGAGLRIESIDVPATEEGTKQRIAAIAALLGVDAAPLTQKLDADVAAARSEADNQPHQPTVLVLYARGPGTAQAFGQNTAADRLLGLAHAKNAAQGFEGSRPITAEAVVAWAPDVLVLPARGLASLGGPAGVLDQPGVRQTPAGRDGRVVAVDDLLLLGFGPRLGQAVRELSRAVHGQP